MSLYFSSFTSELGRCCSQNRFERSLKHLRSLSIIKKEPRTITKRYSMKNKYLSVLFAIAAVAVLPAHAQEPADSLKEVRPFGGHALELLTGREAGVEVISSPGAPGMTPTIHVRGIGVIQGIEPAYIVDGMRRRNLEGISPESIEKIEVLKDATAMGVWGPNAAAGVVVVTTRRASQRGVHAGYEWQGGVQSLAHVPEKMTTEA